MRIAVIDSGINNENKKLNIYKNVKIELTQDNIIQVDDENTTDYSCHANTILWILERYLNDEDEILIIKVLNEQLKAHSLLVIEAIKFAVKENVDIINMSLGTQNIKYAEEMHEAIKEAAAKGIIIVSAANNEGKTSFPAEFPEVITVRPKECYFDEQYWEFFPEKNDILIGNKQWIHNDVYGTSFIAPHVVGVIANICKEKKIKSTEEVFKEMVERYYLYVKTWHE